MTTQSPAITQDEILAKIYRDLTRLAGEIAIDRCRNRVLMKLVREKLDVGDEELNGLFRAELEANLEQLCHDITGPMLRELEEPTAGGCCQA
ncbi:MAG: hypothetical protein JWM80_6691 [Cyanobacteria bacterium RYN_339]|nr:hypothetical protein [Cyanobacteria bacterium RYN_339]